MWEQGVHMAGRRRARRAMKWALLLVNVLVMCTWVGTTFCLLAYDGFDWAVVLERGCIFINTANVTGPPAEIAQARDQLRGAGGLRFHFQGKLFGRAERLGLVPPAILHERARPAIVGKQLMTSPAILRVPFWLVMLTAGTAGTWLWWRDRGHPRPGHCRCGYDLTGNVSGRCPECGVVADNVERPPGGRLSH